MGARAQTVPIDSPDPPPPAQSIPQQSITQVADKLIDVFRSRKPEDWRKLIGFSSQWAQLADHVFSRQALSLCSITLKTF